MRPAGIVARGQAWLIDFGIRVGLFFVLAMVAASMGGMGNAFLLISLFALEWLYPMVFELLPAGGTPGKRAMGLQVVMDNGLPVTPAACVVRNLLRAADFLPFGYAAAAVSLLLRRDFKRLGDVAAGTLVVYSATVKLHGELPPAAPLRPARTLTQDEQAAIVAWAGRAQRLTPERLEELARLAAPAAGAAHGQGANNPASQRLLGVAHWLLGEREPAR
nr:RDD family protein [Ramlibacter albus]